MMGLASVFVVTVIIICEFASQDLGSMINILRSNHQAELHQQLVTQNISRSSHQLMQSGVANRNTNQLTRQPHAVRILP
ncbi:hypothetical protein BDN67DRAFT_966372 [Paxillus ammoniavirescens]|nr:hypothetical protein BDN67DRAFT_966372 [Paxillus ammoniavirescens]